MSVIEPQFVKPHAYNMHLCAVNECKEAPQEQEGEAQQGYP